MFLTFQVNNPVSLLALKHQYFMKNSTHFAPASASSPAATPSVPAVEVSVTDASMVRALDFRPLEPNENDVVRLLCNDLTKRHRYETLPEKNLQIKSR